MDALYQSQLDGIARISNAHRTAEYHGYIDAISCFSFIDHFYVDN
jgi:hypothetical protein